MTTIGDILTAEPFRTLFLPASCDFCTASAPVYTDPETQGRYCLPCLVQATEAERDLREDLPEDPELTAFARQYIAANRAAA